MRHSRRVQSPAEAERDASRLEAQQLEERDKARDAVQPPKQGLDLVAHLARARGFSERTFGPGLRTRGVIAHIRKELAEIEAAPTDLEEWIDVATLAFDGAWRAGYSPEQIACALGAKLAKNEARTWPDWRTASEDAPIEHVRATSASEESRTARALQVLRAAARFTNN